MNHGFLKFGIGIGIGFETFPVFWLVSDSVSKKNYQKNLGFVCLKHGFVKFGIGIGIGFKTFPIFLIVSDSVSKKLKFEGKIYGEMKKRAKPETTRMPTYNASFPCI